MEKLNMLDLKLTEIQKELNDILENIDFEFICEFNMENCESNIPWNLITNPGIYFLEIKNNKRFETFTDWINDFKKEWEDPKYKWRFVPNLKQKRIQMHTELKEWIPIYIGKSHNIKDRIHQHIYKELEQNTFALKLKARENMKNETFRLSMIKLEIKNYDWIVPKFENKLRNKYNPLIGKQ